MEIIEIPQPHDSLFKKGMVSLTVAKDFLHGSLPVDIQQIINWDTLRHTNRSYVKEQLKQLHTDLVFASRSQDDTVYVYCLIMLGVEEKNSGAEIIEAIVNIAPEKKEEVMTAAQKLRAEGRVEGVVEGRAEGVVEGRAEGRVEGVAEGRVQGQQEALRATIGRMYQRGLDMNTIADFTGLSATEVKHFA
ncbi:MAG: Rpn family recombination-promoting nuclease/putative transposase [Bacteroidota bacterium]